MPNNPYWNSDGSFNSSTIYRNTFMGTSSSA